MPMREAVIDRLHIELGAGALTPPPARSEVYDGSTDRHEGTYNPCCPSLAKGHPALRIVIHWQEELDAIVRRIREFAKMT